MEIQNGEDSFLVFIFLLRRKLLERKNKKFFYKLVLSKNFVLDKRKKKNDVKMTEI